MYVTREDFRRRMFEAQIRAIWECRLITFVWGTHDLKESLRVNLDPAWDYAETNCGERRRTLVSKTNYI